VAELTDAARTAIDGIDDLILVFNKLLQIAEAESGMRAEHLGLVDLNRIVHDMGELYDAAAEERSVRLSVRGQAAVWTHGDHDLLASAVGSLIDNAIKYAGPGASVELEARSEAQRVCILVRDNGPGVPTAELPRLSERFYRVDRARSQPGNGLGLAIVSAIAKLHGGELQLINAEPGLCASILLPRPSASQLERTPEISTAPAPAALAHLSHR
jgi:signal transduction histidine kinase